MGVFHPQTDRGDYYRQSLDRPEDETLVNAIEKIRPGFRNDLLRQREQNAQADGLRSQAQHPEADGFNNSDLFDPNAPHMQRLRLDNVKQGERYPQPDAQGVSGQDGQAQVTMAPGNVTPSIRQVAKGGNISDKDMNVSAAGSAINAQANDGRYAGRPEFKRMRFYGR